MAWIIYLMSVVDALHKIGCILFVAALGSTLALGAYIAFVCDEFYRSDEQEEKVTLIKKSVKFWRGFAVTALFCSFIFTILIPSSKTIAAMILVPAVADAAVSAVKNEQVKQLPDKVLQVMNGKLDEWINEMKETQ